MPQIRYKAPDVGDLLTGTHSLGCLRLERTVQLPGTIKHYHSVDPAHWRLLLDAARQHRLLLACPTDASGEALHDVATICRLVDVSKESDTRASFDLHGLARVRVVGANDAAAPYPVLEVVEFDASPVDDQRADELVQSIRGSLEQLADQGYDVAEYALEQALGLHRPDIVADMVGATALHSTDEHRALLTERSVEARLVTVDEALAELLKESDELYPTSRELMN